jgi:charged multivesicular body protein 7
MFPVPFACLLVLVFVALTNAAQWTDLRVQYDINPVGHFRRKPKLEREAVELGWRPVTPTGDCSNGGQYNGFRYIEPEEDSLVLIFDVNGVIAGMQMLLAHSAILSENNTFQYSDVPHFNNATFEGAEYFVLTAYFVNPSIICTSGRNESDLITVGTGEGVWVQEGPTPTTFLEIPMLREEALLTGWSDNNCLGGMGTHSWYRMEDYATTNCTVQTPVFGMWNRQMELQGFGFSAVGLTAKSNFENPPTAAVRLITGAPAPECLFEMSDLVGLTTMHVYFIDNPWLIACSL